MTSVEYQDWCCNIARAPQTYLLIRHHSGKKLWGRCLYIHCIHFELYYEIDYSDVQYGSGIVTNNNILIYKKKDKKGEWIEEPWRRHKLEGQTKLF